MPLGLWIISAIGLAATIFMVWVFSRVGRAENRKPSRVMMISSIRKVAAVLEGEEALPDENDVVACAKAAQKISGE